MVSIKSRRNLTRILNRITLSNYFNEHLKCSLLPRRSKVRFASAFFVKESHPPVSVLLLSRKKSCPAHLTDVANNFLRLCVFNAEYLIVLLSHIGTSCLYCTHALKGKKTCPLRPCACKRTHNAFGSPSPFCDVVGWR